MAATNLNLADLLNEEQGPMLLGVLIGASFHDDRITVTPGLEPGDLPEAHCKGHVVLEYVTKLQAFGPPEE